MGWVFEYSERLLQNCRSFFRSEPTVKELVHKIHGILHFEKSSPAGRRSSTFIEHQRNGEVEYSTLQVYCERLARYTLRNSLSGRVKALQEVIKLTLESSFLRTIFNECKEFNYMRAVAKSSDSTPEIREWTSLAVYVIENELWSKATTDSKARVDLRRILDEHFEVGRKCGTWKCAERPRTLRKTISSYLAVPCNDFGVVPSSTMNRLSTPDRQEERSSPGRLHSDEACLAMSGLPQTENVERLYTFPVSEEVPPKPSSKELLKYVLETAPQGSLENLTDVIKIDPNKDKIIGQGGFSDVYKGTSPVFGKNAVMKLFRIHCEGLDGVKNFAKELRVLSRLRPGHPNVLSPLGYAASENQQYYIVLEWIERGSLRACIGTSTTRQLFDMSLGIAEGLTYLHDIEIVHGDVKAENVLVSTSGVPVLTDFGLSKVNESYTSKGYYSTETPRGSMRWLPHEYYNLGDDEEFRFTEKTDTWAFGMTILELLTNDVPYSYIRSDSRCIVEIMSGHLPRRPNIGDTDPDASLKSYMWSICLKCWIKENKKRPLMRDILKEMKGFLRIGGHG